MPEISSYSGVDMANIAKISGISKGSSGGSYDPVNSTGTYTETVPTSGLIQMGGAYRQANAETTGKTTGTDTVTGFTFGVDIKRNYSSDVNGKWASAETPFSGTVQKISATSQSVWILDTSGQLWGMSNSNSFWGLGGSSTDRSFTKATGIGDSDTGWTDVSCATTTIYAINSGKLYVQGANSYGMYGDGTTTTTYNGWRQVGTDSDWVSISAANGHAAAIKGSNNVLYTAGGNANGRTGQNTTSGNTTTWTAVNATNLVSGTNNNFSHVYASYNHTVAIQSGRAFGCGLVNSQRQLGMNLTSNQTVMVQTGSVSGTLQTDWTKIYVNYYGSHLINSSGHLYYQGSGSNYLSGAGNTTNQYGGDVVRISTWTDAEEVIVDGTIYNPSTLVFKRSGKLYFVGMNRIGNIFPNLGSSYVTQPTVIINSQINGTATYTVPNSANAHTLFAQYQ
jgi:hypothetical protein